MIGRDPAVAEVASIARTGKAGTRFHLIPRPRIQARPHPEKSRTGNSGQKKKSGGAFWAPPLLLEVLIERVLS
jgi:hypothetical protein